METARITDPNFVFYDDNQTMIGVVRTGKNPTMRHLERSHGVCIAWMHEVFQEGYVGLAYEVTAKMAADVHTKAFKDGISWVHACQLINIFPPEHLQSLEVMDMMKPTHGQVADAKGQTQRVHNYKNQTPCFPYTETPILPEELYRAGLSSKEGLQEVDGSDPIVVVKFPRMLRPPPAVIQPGIYKRSTWVLREGQWHRIEDHADIPDHYQKFDCYVERAVFQYHFQRGNLVSTPAAASPMVPALPVGVHCLHRCEVSLQRVVGALARAIHGGSEGQIHDIFERNVASQLPWFWSSLCQSLAIRVDVERKRGSDKELFNGVPYVPAKVQVKKNDKPPSIKFCDAKGKVLYAYDAAKHLDDAQGGVLSATLDPNYAAEITIWAIDATRPVWLLTGVDEDNWWNEFVPDDVQIVCSGSRACASNAGYYAEVAKKFVAKHSDLALAGSGMLGVSSWLDKACSHKGVLNFESPEYPYGDIGMAMKSLAENGKRVMVEIPENDGYQESEQVEQMKGIQGCATTSFDGCCYGHRTSCAAQVLYVKSKWKFLAWGVDLNTMEKSCHDKHQHAGKNESGDENSAVKRTSKVAQKLLKAVNNSNNSNNGAYAMASPDTGKYDRVMIEYCCSKDSSLGKPNAFSKGCKIIRAHEDLNANSKSCEDMIVATTKATKKDHPQARVLVYAALPCTGGSSWQFVNEAGGVNEKVKERKRSFRKLLKSLKRLLLRLAECDPYLAFELPKSCTYWKWPEVQSLVKQYSLIKFRVDGCAVGVVDHAGAPLLKSWCVASNVICMNILEKHLCDGKHEHGMARGVALKEAENFTPLLASTIHEAWKDECASRRRIKPRNREKVVKKAIALPCIAIGDCSSGKFPSCKRLCSAYGQHCGKSTHHRSRSCPEVRVDYVPRTEGSAMAGYTPWQESFEEDDPLPGYSSTMPPPPNQPRRPARTGARSIYETVEVISFQDQRGGVLPDNPLKEIRRVNGVLARLCQAQERLPPKIKHGLVATNQQIMGWARAGVPVTFVAALTAACSPRNDLRTRPRELFRALVYALGDPFYSIGYKDLVEYIKQASSCLARIQNELQPQSTSILFHLVGIEVLKDVNHFVDVLEQDARDRKVDQEASAYDVVRDTNYLNPVLVCKPIRSAGGFLHSTRYQSWYEAQQVYYESTPSAVKLGWNTLILLRNLVENFCAHMAYGLRTHNRDHPDDRMTVIDLVRLVQQHPEDLDAPLAYAVNCFQALNVCAKTLRMYVIDYSYECPEDELKTTIEEALLLVSRPPPIGLGLPDTVTLASHNQLRIESGLLSDYSWMNDAFKMWNQSIEDMDQDIDQGQRPGHVCLMPGDTNYPRPIVAHPPWARSAPQVGEPDVIFPEGPAPPTATQAEVPTPPPAPTPDREQGPKRSRTASESGPRPSSSARPTTASEAASSSTRPRPTVGASSATASASEPEAPPADSGWTIPMEATDHILITHHFKVRSGNFYGTKLAKRKDGGGFVDALDETPRGIVGKTNQQIYLRRLVTMLARSGGLSANIETGFHLPTYIQKGDEEWLRLYNQIYHLMHLGCTQCLPEPAVLTACVFDDRTDEWVRTNFPEEEILALRDAEARLQDAMSNASRPDATVWKGGNTLLITDYNLHSKANNSPSKTSPGIALKNKGWSAIEVYSPPEVSRAQDNVANFAVTVRRAHERLQRVSKDVLSKLTVHVHLSLYGVMLAPLSDEVLESSYIKPITEVHELVPRSAVVTINDDPLFNGLDHNSLSYGIVIKKLAKELRANGCLVLTTSSMWPKLLSVTGGAGHRIKADQAELGWSLFEKSLLNEKILATCMLDTVKINIMSACIKPFNLDHVRINRVFTFIDDDEVKFISADATAGEEQASATRDLARMRRTERRRSDLPFGSEDIALIEPEPYHDHETFWWKIEQYQTPNERTTVPGRAFYCEQCRNTALDSDSLRNSAFGSYCPGCAFKELWRQYQDVVTWDDWKRLEQYAGACAVYLYNNHFLEFDSGEAIYKPRDCIKLFIKHCAFMSRSNLAKTVSSMAALRVPVNIAVEYCQQGRAKHLGWERALTYDGDVCYIAYYDAGNAAYAGYMNCLFTRDEITDMCRGSPDPSEELLGDILETAAGLLVVACRFPELFPKWGGKQEVEACL